MKVLTIQSKDILMSLLNVDEKTPIYPQIRETSSNYLTSRVFKDMHRRLNEKLEKTVVYASTNVFWGFSNLGEDHPLDCNNEFSLEFILRVYNPMIDEKKFNEKYILLELEVPDEEVLESAFYDYCSVLSDEQSGNYDDFYESLYYDCKNKSRTIQVIFPLIRKDMIKRIVTHIKFSPYKKQISDLFDIRSRYLVYKCKLDKYEDIKRHILENLYKQVDTEICKLQETIYEIRNLEVTESDIISYTLEEYKEKLLKDWQIIDKEINISK